MRTSAAIIGLALGVAASAQDTPRWWPAPIPDSMAGRDVVAVRPLASFNHPDGRSVVMHAVRDAMGNYWRVLVNSDAVVSEGDTLLVEPASRDAEILQTRKNK